MDLLKTGLLDGNPLEVQGTTFETFPLAPLLIVPKVVTPSLELNFAKGKQLDSRITFTRASSGTFINSSGLVESASTNVARFTHDPVTLSSLGLFVEESRTNLFLRSEEFSDAYWNKGNASVSANATTAPDGATTADKLVEDTATATHQLFRTVSVTSGQAYTFSLFIKPAGRSRIQFNLPFSFPTSTQAIFDVSTGTVVSSTGGATASISAQANGFYRCVVTATANATANGTLYLALVNTGTTTSYTGDGSSGLFLWGAQVEAGAFATSYIPTTSATVTRAADVVQITGSSFTSWYNQSEGTAVVDTTYPVAGVDTFTFQLSQDGNNYMAIRRTTGNNLVVAARASSNVYDAQTLTGTAGAGRFVTAFSYLTNSGVAASTNGSSIANGASYPNITATSLSVAGFGGGSSNQTIARIRYYPLRLASATIQALSI